MSSLEPKVWPTLPLGDVLALSQYGLNLPATGSGVPMLRMNNLIDGRIDLDDVVHVDLSESDLERFALKPGDILLNRTNSQELVGKVGFYDTNEVAVFASYLIRMRVQEDKMLPAFLFHYLNSESSQQRIKAFSTKGVSQTNINPTNLRRHFRVPVPPLNEQAQLVKFSTLWDSAIALTRSLIAEKELRKKALMQQLLSGKKRLPGFNREWAKKKLGEIFDERNETESLDLPLLSITANRGVILQSESDKKDTSNKDKSKYRRICPGDIGYNTMRMWQGRSALSQLEGIVSPAYTIVTPRKFADGRFFSYLFKTESIIHLFFRNSQGLVDDTLNCKFNEFARVTVQIPSLEEQKAIAQVLQTADKEIKLLQQKLELLKEQKKGLMQKLLTGQIRVKVK